MSDSSNMRMSMIPGSVVEGAVGRYTIENIISMSERSATALCTDGSGVKCRIKLFNGESYLTEEEQKTIMSFPMQGVLLPSDMGQYLGCRFYVFPNMDVTSVDKYPMSINVLVNKFIPQIAYVINQYHNRGIILRDICPEHILYNPDDEEIKYCGFNNLTILKGKATVTKAPSAGQHYSYISPEAPEYGYSRYSDYFSLAVTILSMIKGGNPIEKVTRQEFLTQLSKGMVPGIDVEYLRKTPYEMYSAKDRVLYLVLGLINPNPRNRWGYGEIRCWCNNQKIPLVQKGQRIPYTFNEPFLVRDKKCWNEKQLATELSSEPLAWNDKSLEEVVSFIQKQGLGCSKDIQEYMEQSDLSPEGKLFRVIYTLYPALDGFCWKGRSFPDALSLVDAVQKDILPMSSLSGILSNRCISFFENCRSRIGMGGNTPVSEIDGIEQLERGEYGAGAQRYMMLFASDKNSRLFYVEGEKYSSLRALLEAYKDKPQKLRRISAKILCDSSFQAWLWAKGMETAGQEAASKAEEKPEQAFYMLLAICESDQDDEKTALIARNIYIKHGDFAPILWLGEHVDDYNTSTLTHVGIADNLRLIQASTSDSLQEITSKASSHIKDYQSFVVHTLDNPFEYENFKADSLHCSFIPKNESGYFCCKWDNGIEVCPAFLRSIGEAVPKDQVEEWLERAQRDVLETFKDLSSKLPASSDDESLVSDVEFKDRCSRNRNTAVIMMVAAAVLFIMTIKHSVIVGFIALVIALLYPAKAFGFYSDRFNKADIWMRRKKDIKDKHNEIENRIRRVNSRKSEIQNGILSGKDNSCRSLDNELIITETEAEAPESLDVEKSDKILAGLSLVGFVLMAASYGSSRAETLFAAAIYGAMYGIGVPFLLRNKKDLFGSITLWAIVTTVVTSAALIFAGKYGASFFVTMITLPIAIGIIILIIGLILAFM